jgi:hypothetical protein
MPRYDTLLTHTDKIITAAIRIALHAVSFCAVENALITGVLITGVLSTISI